LSTLGDAVMARTLRMPLVAATPGDGAAAARQLDVALMGVGFKLTGELLTRLSAVDGDAVTAAGARLIAVVGRLVGDDVRHNVYFREFPRNVPDTLDFWVQCIRTALADPAVAGRIEEQLAAGWLNLLDLPTYGRYQHSYEEMVAAHQALVPSLKDRLTPVRAGDSEADEAHRLYLELAASPVPLPDDDLELLADLARYCVDRPQPESLPVREVRAVVNRARLAAGRDVLTDTVTDVLRLACAVSDGDVGLSEPTRFRSLRRAERRVLMTALDRVVAANDERLTDVPRHREAWKRLGERLHPHEYPRLAHAAEVFAVARGDRPAHSVAARVESALAAGDLTAAIDLLAARPGMLLRALDRLLRTATPQQIPDVVAAVERVVGAPALSGRVLLSLREFLHNRTTPAPARAFTNRRGRVWVATKQLSPLPSAPVERVLDLLDAEIVRRLPKGGTVVVDPAVRPVTLPLSQRSTASGFGVLPRGSHTPVDGTYLRFFVYWRQRELRTDYDLSALMLDDRFRKVGQLSYTNLTGFGGVHSGDITEAPDGASEFIDVDLGRMPGRYLIPMVNVFSGENFVDVADSFFGYMQRDPAQFGQPFEARTVRMKSTLVGTGRVALPLVFVRGEHGDWSARWLHLYLTGFPKFNAVENNANTTTLLVRGMLERSYLTIGDMLELMRRAGTDVTTWSDGVPVPADATYIGLEPPEHVEPGARVYATSRLHELIPG
jgi:hypothetical protein